MPCSHHTPFVAAYLFALAIIWAYLGEAATAAALILSLVNWGMGRRWSCATTSSLMPQESAADGTPQDPSPA